MKRIVSILILVLYMLPAFGFHVNIHYCGGAVSSVNFGNEASACGCGSAIMKKNCCEDRKVSFELQDAHNVQPQLVWSDNEQQYADYLPTQNFFYSINHFEYRYNAVAISPPPEKEFKPIYILNSVFLI